MTPAQSPASAPAGTGAGTGPPRQDIPADQGGPAARTAGSGRSSYKRLRTGPSNWLLAPALSFFGVFALLPLLGVVVLSFFAWDGLGRSEEHTSELQSRGHLVCRLLLEKKNIASRGMDIMWQLIDSIPL